MLEVLELLVEAAYTRDKEVSLRRANLRLEVVRHLWRLAHELKVSATKLVGSDLVLCTARADSILDLPIQKRDWLIGLWCRAADVFMKDAGDQALIGQALLGGALLEQLKVGGR